MAAPVKTVSLEDAKNALKEALQLFKQPENIQKLNDAKAAAGGDIMKVITLVTPIGISIASSIMTKYGFEPTQPGVMQFFTAVNQHNADPEVAQLTNEFRALLMPTTPFAAQKA